VTVDIDDPPVLTLPSDRDICLSPAESLCISGIVATDPNSGDTLILEKVSGPGTFVPDTGFSPLSRSICFDPASNDSTYQFVFRVTDSCDSTRQDTFRVSVNINQPPVLMLPGDRDTILCDVQVTCFDSIIAFDPDLGDTFIVTKIEGPGTFAPDTAIAPETINTIHCFTPADRDSTYRFIFEVVDSCGTADRDTFNLTVDINQAPVISAPDTLWVIRESSNRDTLTAADPDSHVILDSAGVSVDPDCGEYSVTRISNPGGASGQWEIIFNDTNCFVDTIYNMVVDLRDTIPGAGCPGKAGYDSIIVIIRSQAHYNNPPLVFAPTDASGFVGDEIELFFTAADPDSDVIVDTSEVFVKPTYCGNTLVERLTPSGKPSGQWKVTFDTQGCLPGDHWVMLALKDTLGAWGWDSAFVTLSAVDVPDTSSTAEIDFALEQNYPNPFNQETGLSFQVPYRCWVSLKIYNLKGQLVNTLAQGEMEKGKHIVFWYGTDFRGDEVASGIYFYKLTASDFVSVRKMILLK